MKFTRIKFIYQEPLTEDQLGILRVNLEAIRDNAVKAMRQHLLTRLGGQMKAKLEIMANICEMGIEITNPKPNEMDFIFPNLDLTGQAIVFRNKQYTFGKLIPEKRVIRFIKNDVSKDMRIDKDTVLYEIEEYQQDTDKH